MILTVLVSIAVFILGLILLSYGASLLIEASSSLAKHLKVSNLVIGLSVIALGTSLPEFIVSLFAVLNGSTELSIGNILGSNIANIALILGWTGLLYSVIYNKEKEKQHLNVKILLMLIVFVIFFFLSSDGLLSRLDGAILFFLFVIFLFITFKMNDISKKIDENIKHRKIIAVILVVLGICGLLIGARFMTSSAIYIAKVFGIREYVIGATIVAIGTSLPELAASSFAIKKGETGMSIGNIVGSNLFNILMVLGIVAMIHPLKFSFNLLAIDYIIMIATGILLYINNISRDKISKPMAAIFAAIYIGYIIRLLTIAH